MPTVAEVLKSTGLTEDQIAALDAKVLEGFTGVLTTAEQERNRAELAQRAANEMFETQITPALNKWGNDEANLKAERDYYKGLAEGAKAGGFVAEVPPFKPEQGRGEGGRFVADKNEVPGSPNLEQLQTRMGEAMGNLADLTWRYESLYGTKMPDAPTKLAAEAAAQRMSMVEYAAKKYDFAGKEAAQRKAEQEKHDEAIRKAATEDRDKYWAERSGANPNVRMGETSKFSELTKGVKDGTRVDPLKMTREQRHAATAQQIRQDVAAAVN